MSRTVDAALAPGEGALGRLASLGAGSGSGVPFYAAPFTDWERERSMLRAVAGEKLEAASKAIDDPARFAAIYRVGDVNALPKSLLVRALALNLESQLTKSFERIDDYRRFTSGAAPR